MTPACETEHEIILKIYPGVYPGFDWKGKNSVFKGHRMLYDPVAPAVAIVKVRNFLAKHLK